MSGEDVLNNFASAHITSLRQNKDFISKWNKMAILTFVSNNSKKIKLNIQKKKHKSNVIGMLNTC